MPTPDIRELISIFVGGFAGALARAGLAQLAPESPSAWPWTTFVVNIVGALLLGYFATRLQERLPLSTYQRPLIGTGLCGALTTFSTLQLEVLHMLDHSEYDLACAYVLSSIAAGTMAILAAQAVARRVRLIA
jgi:CrcB protein